MATKDQVMALHGSHPDWTAADIAHELGCVPQYVCATAKRQGLKLPSSRRGPSSMTRQIVALHRLHPEYGVEDVVRELGCAQSWVRNVARVEGLDLAGVRRVTPEGLISRARLLERQAQALRLRAARIAGNFAQT